MNFFLRKRTEGSDCWDTSEIVWDKMDWKYTAIRIFNERFIDIVQTLEMLSTEDNTDAMQKAFLLHCGVTGTRYIICMKLIGTYCSKLEIATRRVSNRIQKLFELFQSDKENNDIRVWQNHCDLWKKMLKRLVWFAPNLELSENKSIRWTSLVKLYPNTTKYGFFFLT